MPSFDTICEADLVEVRNAVDNTVKEIGTRFDFKGTAAAIELKDKDITLIGDAEFQLGQIEDVLRNKLTKRGVDIRFLDRGDVQKMGGDKVKQVIKVRNGIETEVSKKIQRLIKDSKLKLQASIQGDAVRVTGAGLEHICLVGLLHQPLAQDFDLEHQRFYITGEHDIAAATEDELGLTHQIGGIDHVLQVLFAGDTRQRMRLCHDVKGVAGLERDVFLD